MQHTTPGAGDPAARSTGRRAPRVPRRRPRPQRGPRAGRGRGAPPRRGGAPRAPERFGHGQVRYAPAAPGSGLPVVGELVAVLAAAADRSEPEPPGGGAVLREAACGYWWRRGLRCHPEDLAAAPGAGPLLAAVLAAHGGDVLMPRPCPLGWTPQARLLGRSAYHVPTPAECGGVPDSYALLETVRRVRAEGGHPAVLLLCVADDPTGTVAPPELVREACEAAVAEGLHIVSDETWRDTLHRPHDTVLVSPGEMCPGDVTVLSDLSGAVAPASWPAAVARFPRAPPRPRRTGPASSTCSPPSARGCPAHWPRPSPTPSTSRHR